MRYTDKKPYVEEMHLNGVNRQKIYKQSFVHDPFFFDFNTLRYDRSADNVTPGKTPFSMLLDIRLSKNRLKNKQKQTKKTSKQTINNNKQTKQDKKKNKQRKNKNNNNKKTKTKRTPSQIIFLKYTLPKSQQTYNFNEIEIFVHKL